MSKSKRRSAYRRGHIAELLACFALILKGYRILERRCRTPVGEIDIIARRKDLILFVEVKARRDTQTALDSISVTAQKRIESAAEYWLSRQREGARYSWRFDAVTVKPWSWPEHFKNVW